MRKHLGEFHPEEWIDTCDRMGIRIKAQQSQHVVAAFHRRHNQHDLLNEMTNAMSTDRPLFSGEAFLDAIVEFIVADDQSINVIECRQLRNIFLLLCKELQDSDIPHRTTVHNCIFQLWEEYIRDLSSEMKVCFHHTPGHHTGELLAQIFLRVLDRFGVAAKIGWITLDNASPNDTFVETLEQELACRGIEFDKVTRRIRYVI
ncbi:hypothetical protein NEOLEDRAFT_1193291 [Neolentinus lepideus HHB14362 ss-1]|uniref:Uncharacterized protein n=1 Tax=Neolentinus lepideus HHB14362 ss-1 TaxID=1314782 RepID=A0A165TW63_9AGAM|nr:hypothetical protein NEOLEDRAFT_1193291 [Neolentinus lepideus HHB14362 ss-1]